MAKHDSAVREAEAKLEEATARARRSGEVFSGRGAGAEMLDAYEAWMVARASEGDPFARSLGYTAEGWSLAAWIEGRAAKRHGTGAVHALADD
jgi:hypothetical protein